MLLVVLAASAIVAAALASAAAVPQLPLAHETDAIDTLFDEFVAEHGRVYKSDLHRATARAAFAVNVERARALNAARTSDGDAWFGVTKFMDETESSMARYKMRPFTPTEATAGLRRRVRTATAAANVADLPPAFDWRRHNAVTPVKNQKACGSCWAFSTAEALESAWLIAGKYKGDVKNFGLSVEQIVDCCPLGFGCDGGSPPLTMEWLMHSEGGLMSDTDYPYHYNGSHWGCHFDAKKIVATISSWEFANGWFGGEKELLKSMVSTGPPSVCVAAENWDLYQGGVMTQAQCGKHESLDHAVQLVAYNHTAAPPYLVVRNSWGTDWGYSGYIHLATDSNTCGVTDLTSLPIV